MQTQEQCLQDQDQKIQSLPRPLLTRLASLAELAGTPLMPCALTCSPTCLRGALVLTFRINIVCISIGGRVLRACIVLAFCIVVVVVFFFVILSVGLVSVRVRWRVLRACIVLTLCVVVVFVVIIPCPVFV